MEIIHSQIEKIRKEKKNHKLVIFVGAGVSRNSGACSWFELVKEIAEKIKYSKCNDCEMKAINCTFCDNKVKVCNDNCYFKYNFSNEEFLLIPQLFFDSQDENHEEYYSFIRDKFSAVGKPNIIDDIIISLDPECIITTNYDHLIEDVVNPNVLKFTVIKNDKELLYKKGDRYIIKMHGDIDDVKNIVLKEDDYLQYSQNHTLMETYIKSLLIDKTFLFVGYSLNDNNLKLIMSYIDYFVKENNVTDRTPHYLVLSEISNKTKNRKYWKNKGIDLIDLEKISEEMINKVPCESLVNKTAKRLYTFLSYINNSSLEYSSDREKQLKTILLQASRTMSDFHFIGYRTLLRMCQFEHLDMIRTPELVFRDDSEFELFKAVTTGVNSKKIRQLFIKSGIYGAELIGKKRKSYLFPETDIEDKMSEELFELSIRNKYSEILKKLEKQGPSNEKAYYYSLIHCTSGVKELLEEVEEKLNRKSNLNSCFYYEWAIFEFNRLSYKSLFFEQDKDFERFNSIVDNATIMYGDAYTTIKNITNRNADIQEMNDLLLKHEDSYMKKEAVIKYGGTIYAELPLIKQIMYEYYLFYKKNFLMLDWFNNVESMATPYVKAILCTYYPDKYQYKNNSVFGRTEVKSYPISLLDIDIIVKHIKAKSIKTWVDTYKVEKIQVDSNVDISLIFEDFCKSMREYWNSNMVQQFASFCYLISIVELNTSQIERVIRSVLKVVSPSEDGNIQMLINGVADIFAIVDIHFCKEIRVFYDLLELLIDPRIVHGATTYLKDYRNLIKRLSPIVDEKAYKICSEIIENNPNDSNCLVYYFAPILFKYERAKWIKFVKTNINQLSIEAVFQFVSDGILEFDISVKIYYENKLNELYKQCGKNGFYKIVPDDRSIIIEHLIVLLLMRRIPNKHDIDFLKNYISDSDYIKFLFTEETFDYSKVDTADYMWCNFFKNDIFREQLLKHKSDFWTKDKERRILLGFGSSDEHSIVYKYLI